MGWIRIPEVKWKEAEIVYVWLFYFNRTFIFYVLHCSWHAKPFLRFFDSGLQIIGLASLSLYIQYISVYILCSSTNKSFTLYVMSYCAILVYKVSAWNIYDWVFLIGLCMSFCRCCAAAGCAGLDTVQRTLHHCTAVQPCPSAPVCWGLGRMSRICSRGGPVSEQRMGWHGCTGEVYFSI